MPNGVLNSKVRINEYFLKTIKLVQYEAYNMCR